MGRVPANDVSCGTSHASSTARCLFRMRTAVKVSILVLAGLATFQLYVNVLSIERTVRLKTFSFSVPIARSATSGKGNNISTTAVPDLGARRKESAGRSPGVMKALWDRVNRHLDWLRSSTDGENSPTPAEPRAKLPVCTVTSPGLVGFRAPNQTVPNPLELITAFPYLKPGGDYRPPDCRPKQRTAIIIPYRNRWHHLHILLNNLVPFLVRQQASFTIFVIEQEPSSTFNRALLLNVGFLEARKLDNYTCFIFHDVDLVPLDDHNLYRCSDNPRHMAVGTSKHKYMLPYAKYFGGVSALSKEQVEKVNGNSNLYFGWGGEDDDLYKRVIHKGMKVVRYPVQIARYDMIRHVRDKGNERNPLRDKLLRLATKRIEQDGLNTARYLVTSLQQKPLYTWLTVFVNQTDILTNAPETERRLFVGHQKRMTAIKPPAQKLVRPQVHMGTLKNGTAKQTART